MSEPDHKLPESTRRLVAFLLETPPSPGRESLLVAARANLYNDFLSDHPVPIRLLVEHARFYVGGDTGEAIAQAAMSGAFDATHAESQAWAASPEGRRALAQLGTPHHRR